MIHTSETICALSTPSGSGAIGVIRLSGSNAISIANSIFEGKNLEQQKGQPNFWATLFVFILR